MFRGDTNKTYQITEQFTASDLRTNTFVNTGFQDAAGNDLDLTNLKEGNQSDYVDVDEDQIDKVDYHRLRLAYNKCDEGAMPVIQYDLKVDPATGKVVAGKTIDPADMTVKKSTEVPSPYTTVGDDEVIYLYDTGELLLGNNVYKELSNLVDDPLTSGVNEGEIRVSYQKTEFKEGDLKPEHYFYCVAAGEDGTLDTTLGDLDAPSDKDIVYNPKYLNHGQERQVIEYDVGYNQRLQVNTIAEEAFNPDVNREVDDMIQALERVQKVEDGEHHKGVNGERDQRR